MFSTESDNFRSIISYRVRFSAITYRMSDLANKNTGDPVKFPFLINKI